MKHAFVPAVFCATFACAAAEPPNCATFFAAPLRTGEPSAVAQMGLAAVTGKKPVRFSDCAGPSCRVKAYVVRGDLVATGLRENGWICAMFPNQSGGTVGWLPANALKPSPAENARPLSAWAGKWQWGDVADLEIKVADDWLTVEGKAFWMGSEPGQIHDGELEGKAKPARGLLALRDPDDEDSCVVMLRLIGPYLAVQDNGKCGGANVTFTGVYRRM